MQQQIITSKSPVLDLHGEVVSMVESIVDQFVKDNYNLKISNVRIIHGKSTNILTTEVHRILKKNKFVKKFYLNNWNLGETIVEIDIDKSI
jgi:dsDNA-specific endonuclease/ATPase MutS2